MCLDKRSAMCDHSSFACRRDPAFGYAHACVCGYFRIKKNDIIMLYIWI